MTVKLITVSAVRNRMKLDDDESIDLVISSAIQGMAVGMSGRLKTSLARGTATEVFHLPPGTVANGGTFQLQLRNGFVSGVSVSTKNALDDSATPLTPLKTRAEEGYVVVPEFVGSSPIPSYVQISYTYGFGDNDPNVPAWLAEAALCYSVQLMAMQQLNDSKAETNGVLAMMKEHIAVLVKSNFRMDARSIHPIM